MLSLLLILCLGAPGDHDIERQLKAHVRFLADDLLEGRESAERGQKVAARYLATHLQAYGLTPAFPAAEEPYYQPFALRHDTDEGSVTLYARGNGRKHWFTHGEEFLAQISGRGSLNEKAPMVFAGYGLETPFYNDYADLDVTDRWVVILEGQPNRETGPFAKPLMEANDLAKLRLAKSKKPFGVIFLTGDFEPNPKADAFMDQNPAKSSFPVLFLPQNMWKYLFGKDINPFNEAVEKINQTAEPQSFYVKRRQLEISALPPSWEKVAENVVGIIPGSDPKLKDEYIVVSAHFDHLGIVDGQIHNGADDNATGTSTLLVAAQRLREMKLKRSVLFLWTAGEEKGLLGSHHFVKHPAVPLEQIVANVNIDMIGRNDNNAIGVIPSERDGVSTMNDLVAKLNSKKRHRLVLRHDMDQFHGRSDHFNFYQAGIPAIFFFSGTHEDYHKPGDDWEKLDYPKLARFYGLLEEFLVTLANQKQAPEFKGSHDSGSGRSHLSKSGLNAPDGGQPEPAPDRPAN